MALNRDVIIKKLMHGKCKRVAEKLGVAQSTVSMVNIGQRANIDITNALLEEEAEAYREADRIIKEDKEKRKNAKKGFLKGVAASYFFCLCVSYSQLF